MCPRRTWDSPEADIQPGDPRPDVSLQLYEDSPSSAQDAPWGGSAVPSCGRGQRGSGGDLTCDHGRIQEEVSAGGVETPLGAGGLPSRTRGD